MESKLGLNFELVDQARAVAAALKKWGCMTR